MVFYLGNSKQQTRGKFLPDLLASSILVRPNMQLWHTDPKEVGNLCGAASLLSTASLLLTVSRHFFLANLENIGYSVLMIFNNHFFSEDN